MATNGRGEETYPYGIEPGGHRLPADVRLGPVRLRVRSLDRSVEYYQRVLGLLVSEQEGGRAVLAAEGEGATLIELYEREGAAAVPRRGRLGLYHFAILLPDRGALGRFARHLSRIGEPAGASDHLVSEAFYLRDPDGLGIEVYADRPSTSWRHQGRQLVMATDPLDVEAVTRAGGAEPWTGMPEGTVIGHVHLHVGDLDRAEAFYHGALGLDKVVWSYPGALFLSAGGYHHHLGVNTWAAGAGPPGEDEGQLLEWEIQVPTADDAARALASLEEAGHGVERAPDGAVVRDPWGIPLRIRSR